MNADTGKQEWRTQLDGPLTTSVATTPTAVYVGTRTGTLYRVDPRTGAVLKSLKVDEKLAPRSVPTIAGDTVLVLLTDETATYRAIAALDLSLAQIRWRNAAPRSWGTTRAFVSQDTVILGTPSGEIVAYRVTDGSTAWSRTVSGSIRSIGEAGDTIFVSTSQGSLYAFKRDGS